ncbi:DUF1826 domain-containing protein [Pseudoalteromonas tunicata]|uniref:DUF1826 domain-containing protein n=1 Tax=Pseudoalteromonas tunicata TaxID=314281 RepID=UPI00273EA9BC|nr:DUF1826 domain-containing protein [Pseudoalteromonas tunicata]MDP5214691.1 DUF1826 domain-containing protein [Pseudoalteromonas tunicata]
MFAPQLNQSFTQACYPIDNHAHILSEIYQTNAALACYCSAANWALSQAAKKFASQQHGEVLRYQGAVNNDLASNIDSIFQTSTHGNLITNHVMLMLDMFVTLFEPKEIGLRIISCDHAHSPAFHQNQMIVRMACALGGTGEQWITHQDAEFLPMQATDTRHRIKQPDPAVINHFCDGDIAVYKGTNWIDHEVHALISASPEFKGHDARLCIYIDFLA